MQLPLDKNVLYVRVDENRWDAMGNKTLRNKYLTNLLTSLGGVDESVTPGWYIFKAKIDWKRFKLMVSLEEAKPEFWMF